jgi:hypothetical protein
MFPYQHPVCTPSQASFICFAPVVLNNQSEYEAGHVQHRATCRKCTGAYFMIPEYLQNTACRLSRISSVGCKPASGRVWQATTKWVCIKWPCGYGRPRSQPATFVIRNSRLDIERNVVTQRPNQLLSFCTFLGWRQLPSFTRLCARIFSFAWHSTTTCSA